jgi:hypothetical protein
MILEISVGTMQIKYPTYRRESKANSRIYCNVYHSSRPRLPAEESSDTATCHVAPDSASLLGRAPALPHVTQLRTRFPGEDGYDAATCPTAPDPPPGWGGLRHCRGPQV